MLINSLRTKALKSLDLEHNKAKEKQETKPIYFKHFWSSETTSVSPENAFTTKSEHLHLRASRYSKVYSLDQAPEALRLIFLFLLS